MRSQWLPYTPSTKSTSGRDGSWSANRIRTSAMPAGDDQRAKSCLDVALGDVPDSEALTSFGAASASAPSLASELSWLPLLSLRKPPLWLAAWDRLVALALLITFISIDTWPKKHRNDCCLFHMRDSPYSPAQLAIWYTSISWVATTSVRIPHPRQCHKKQRRKLSKANAGLRH